MARIRVNTTKMEIVQVATKMFLEKGFSSTSIKAVCDELGISTGNLTFYFPTKEHILAELVEMLCNFQRKIMYDVVQEGNTSLAALCLELAAMAAMCEEDEILKDFFLSSYSHHLTLEIIRKNDAERAQMVFAEYCPDWETEDYIEAEILVSGIEYATLMTTDKSLPLDVRIAGALNNIMMTYNVPEDVRKAKIAKILALDYRQIGRRIVLELKEYVNNVNKNAFEELLHK